MYYALPSQTEKGIRQISYAILAFLITNVLSIVVVLALLPIIGDVLAGHFTPGMLGAAIGILVGACALLIVELIGLIFGLLGLVAVHRGRNEFGPEHGKMLDRATIVLVVGIVLGIAGNVYVGVGGALVPSTSLATEGASLGIGIAEAVLVGLFLLWAVDALNTPPGKTRGLIALILGSLSGVIALAVAVIVFAMIPSGASLQDYVVALIAPSAVGVVLSIISIVLWYMIYRDILRRFASGEIRPAPPTPMYPPPYPGYAPPPYVPAAPYYPPPQAPPPQQPPPPQGPPPGP